MPIAIAAVAAGGLAAWGSSQAKGKKKGTENAMAEISQRLYERGQATPQETSQYEGSFDTGKLLQQLYQYQMGLGQAPSGYQDPTQQYLQQSGELGQALYGQTLGAAKDPYAYYQSTLEPQLQLVEDQINRQAQQRGLLRSGIPIEQMGRAGAELAIQEANSRMNFRNQSLQQAAGLSGYMQGQQENRIAGLQNLYGQQQQFGLNAMGRQAGQAQAAAPYSFYPYQAQLGAEYASGAGTPNTAAYGIGTAFNTYMQMRGMGGVGQGAGQGGGR